MEEGLGRRTHHVPAGARRAAGVSAPTSVRHVPGGGHGESCCRGGKRPVPSSPPRGNPDLTFRSRQSHRAPGTRAGGQAAPTPLPGEGAAGRDPQPSSPLLSLLLLLAACLALASVPGAGTPPLPQPSRLPASREGGGGHGGVTSSPNRRFPPALGTASGASQPSPGLLLLLPSTPNKHSTGEVTSILPTSLGETEARLHMGAPPATRSRRGAHGAPTCVSSVSGSSFVLFLALSLPPEHRPAAAIDPSAIDRPLLPCHRTLPGAALPSGTLVALKVASCQHLGFFHPLGTRVHPAHVPSCGHAVALCLSFPG